jgi:tetratricopeptide (TPR) repeat protein
MDCRKSLLLALSLALGGAGCVSSPNLKARTEVAFADFKVRDATSRPELAPGQKEATYDQARVAYQRALEVDPNCKEAYAGLARLYATVGRDDKAVDTFRKVLKKYPREAPLWLDLGMCYSRKKDWPAAVDCLSKAHELDPDKRVYTWALGVTLARVGKCQQSVACLAQAMPQAEAEYNEARILLRLGQDELGRQYLNLALQTNPALVGARDLLAQLEGRGSERGQPVVNVSFAAEGPDLDAPTRQ